MKLRCLFHIHTRRSLDCLLAPAKVVGRARAAGAQILIVTDHESIRGSEDVRQLAKGNPQFVIKAGEYKTEKGDIIALFLKENIRSRNSNQVLREIREQRGLAVLPHPYKGHTLDDELLDQIDLIETFNARCTAAQNDLAKSLARSLGKPEIVGCDAHSSSEMITAMNEFWVDRQIEESNLPELLRAAPRTFHTERVSKIYQPYSGMVKACRTLDLISFGYQLKRMASVVLQELLLDR